MGVVLAVAAAAAYVAAVRVVARRGRRWPVTRTLAFLAGAAVLAAASGPWAEGAADRRFTAHVVQHLLVGMVAPPLLALGAPVTLALQAAPPRRRAAVNRALHQPVLTFPLQPVVGWLLFVASLFVFYFSPLYGWSERSLLVHEAVHVHFLLAGVAWAWPVVGVDLTPHRVGFAGRALSVALAVPFHAFLGLAIMTSSRPWPGATVADQRLGGGVLWLAGDVVVLAVLAVVVVQWAADDDRRARREDRALAPPVPHAHAQPVLVPGLRAPARNPGTRTGEGRVSG